MREGLYRMEWERVVTLPVDEIIQRYYRPEHLLPLCKACPNYGVNHACPPTDQDLLGVMRGFSYMHLHAAKLYLSEAVQGSEVGDIFDHGMVAFNAQLLEREARNKGSMAISPGKCRICPACTRVQGKPCCFPDRMRLSMDAFSLEIAQMLEEWYQIEVQWYKDDQPKYLTMMGGILSNSPALLAEGRK